jgi:hypothetical protein
VSKSDTGRLVPCPVRWMIQPAAPIIQRTGGRNRRARQLPCVRQPLDQTRQPAHVHDRRHPQHPDGDGGGGHPPDRPDLQDWRRRRPGPTRPGVQGPDQGLQPQGPATTTTTASTSSSRVGAGLPAGRRREGGHAAFGAAVGHGDRRLHLPQRLVLSTRLASVGTRFALAIRTVASEPPLDSGRPARRCGWSCRIL